MVKAIITATAAIEIAIAIAIAIIIVIAIIIIIVIAIVIVIAIIITIIEKAKRIINAVVAAAVFVEGVQYVKDVKRLEFSANLHGMNIRGKK